MTDLSRIFDGETHWFEPGEHFTDEGATLVLDGFEEMEEEDVLSPFESPSQTPILRETGRELSARQEEMFPLRKLEHAWGSLSIDLTAFCNIAQMEKKQYQHVWPGQGSVKGEVKWSFQMTTEERITERM